MLFYYINHIKWIKKCVFKKTYQLVSEIRKIKLSDNQVYSSVEVYQLLCRKFYTSFERFKKKQTICLLKFNFLEKKCISQNNVKI